MFYSVYTKQHFSIQYFNICIYKVTEWSILPENQNDFIKVFFLVAYVYEYDFEFVFFFLDQQQ